MTSGFPPARAGTRLRPTPGRFHAGIGYVASPMARIAHRPSRRPAEPATDFIVQIIRLGAGGSVTKTGPLNAHSGGYARECPAQQRSPTVAASEPYMRTERRLCAQEPSDAHVAHGAQISHSGVLRPGERRIMSALAEPCPALSSEAAAAGVAADAAIAADDDSISDAASACPARADVRSWLFDRAQWPHQYPPQGGCPAEAMARYEEPGRAYSC